MYSHTAWRLDMSCMHTWVSAHPARIQCLFQFLLPFLWSLISPTLCDLWPLTPLASTKHLPPHSSPCVMFSLSGTVNPRDGCAWKSTRRSHFDTNNHVQSNSNPLTSLFWSSARLDELSATMHAGLKVPCDWPIRPLRKQPLEIVPYECCLTCRDETIVTADECWCATTMLTVTIITILLFTHLESVYNQ